ncbi:hypothetical protein Mapa_006677 [Marchantia paleacea]|nr:hypothetical protein Mapa_006677 [Marchantia paleacea]
MLSFSFSATVAKVTLDFFFLSLPSEALSELPEVPFASWGSRAASLNFTRSWLASTSPSLVRSSSISASSTI